MSWLIAGIYIAGFLACCRAVYSKMIALQVRDNAHSNARNRFSEPATIDGEDRALAAVMGAAVAVVWPLAAIGYLPWQWITRPTPAELDAEDRAELERLRELARKYDLPMEDS
jgi:hypothetical protein